MAAEEELAKVGINIDAQLPRVAGALRYIGTHYLEPITMQDILDASGYAPRRLQDAFQQHIGMSPSALTIRLRLEAARRILLRAPRTMTVRKVAAKVGLPHAGRFAIRYKALFGETPTETLRANDAR